MRAVRSLPGDQIAMVRINFEGRPAAAIAAVQESSDDPGHYEVRPLCLVLDDDTLERITDAEGDTLEPLDIPNTG